MSDEPEERVQDPHAIYHDPTLYYEEIENSTMSTVRPATTAEVATERIRFSATGKCLHRIVRDTKGWLYDTRSCAICGAGIGAI